MNDTLNTAALDRAPAGAHLPAGRGRPRILIAGDCSPWSRTLIKLFESELKRAGYEVVEGGQLDRPGIEKQAAQIELALVVLDGPADPGLGLAEWFRINQTGIRLLIVREAHWQLNESVPALGRVPQIVMPFTSSELVERIGRLLGSDFYFNVPQPTDLPPAAHSQR